MSYEIQVSRGRFELNLYGEPSRVNVLEMSPRQLEVPLRTGYWLVLLVAVWSGPDRENLGRFLSSADKLPKWLNLGVRLFDDSRETATWCPGLEQVYGSPIWVVLKNGEQVAHQVGTRSIEDLLGWMDSLSHQEG